MNKSITICYCLRNDDYQKKLIEKFIFSLNFNLFNIKKLSLLNRFKVLIIDDLIATGGTANAAAKLVEISNGKVAGFIFVINLFDLNGSDNLIKKGYRVENLIDFPGH